MHAATAAALGCNICQQDSPADAVERAQVAPNVRKFSRERFEVWRCPRCRSLHALEEVDLGHYYASYPFHDLPIDWRLRAMYRNQLRRLQRAGLTTAHHILDFGCGSGHFVDYLKAQGYAHAHGYDEYSERHADPSTLERSYDFVISQDVVEHVPDPLSLLRQFDAVTRPGGVIAIGTPNAEAIDLEHAADNIHVLHQPYHRHIFSQAALREAGQALGWNVERYYPTMYADTLVPFINRRFVLHYFQCFDNTLDVVTDPIRLTRWKLWSPATLIYALFGYFFATETDITLIFRRPQAKALPS